MASLKKGPGGGTLFVAALEPGHPGEAVLTVGVPGGGVLSLSSASWAAAMDCTRLGTACVLVMDPKAWHALEGAATRLLAAPCEVPWSGEGAGACVTPPLTVLPLSAPHTHHLRSPSAKRPRGVLLASYTAARVHACLLAAREGGLGRQLKAKKKPAPKSVAAQEEVACVALVEALAFAFATQDIPLRWRRWGGTACVCWGVRWRAWV